MQTARSTRRQERRPGMARQACRSCGTVGCLKFARLDRLVSVQALRGLGAPGRHQRRSIVSGQYLKVTPVIDRCRSVLNEMFKR